MPITTGFASFLSTKSKALIKKFAIQLGKVDDVKGDRLFKYESMDGDETEYHVFHGIQRAVTVPEGGDPVESMPQVGYAKKYATRQMGRSIVITRKASRLADKRIAQWNKMLVNSAKQTKELWKANFYTFCLSGATVPTVNGAPIINPTCINGNTYFNAAHGFRGITGVSNSNLSPATRSLTLANLQSAAQQVRAWKGPDGMPMQLDIKALWVGDNLIETAKVLLNTMAVPGNANNDNNPLRYVNNGVGINNIEHWSLMGTTDWMLQMDIASLDNPGWCIGEFESMRMLNYQSASGERHVYGYLFECEVFGVEPYEYLTNRAAV